MTLSSPKEKKKELMRQNDGMYDVNPEQRDDRRDDTDEEVNTCKCIMYV